MENNKFTREQKLLIEMVMRQTNLSFDDSSEQLKKHNNNYINVIKESLGITKNNEQKNIKSVNQEIYTEIRGLMDNASERYRKQKEIEKQKEIIIDKLREEYNLRKNKALKEKEDLMGVPLEEEGLRGIPLEEEGLRGIPLEEEGLRGIPLEEEGLRGIPLEEEEEELEVVTIQGKNYFTTDEKNGDIYEYINDEEVGDKVGSYNKDGIAIFD